MPDAAISGGDALGSEIALSLALFAMTNGECHPRGGRMPDEGTFTDRVRTNRCFAIQAVISGGLLLNVSSLGTEPFILIELILALVI